VGDAKQLIGFSAVSNFGSYNQADREWFGMGEAGCGLWNITKSPTARPLSMLSGWAILCAHYPNRLDSFAECCSSALEGLVLLYQITGEQRLAHQPESRRGSPIFRDLIPRTWIHGVGGNRSVDRRTAS
jgi:hypothetical protein